MKILSWNINGVRAAFHSGKLQSCLQTYEPDLLCLQETKWSPDMQADPLGVRECQGYRSFWHSASRLGYSGVAFYFRRPPEKIHVGLGIPEIDQEGRVLWAEYPNFDVVNAYFPNSQEKGARLAYKLFFCEKLFHFLEFLRHRNTSIGKSARQGQRGLLLCGDINIAHRPIDLVHPERHQQSPGFLPEERAWMDFFLSQGYHDAFRLLHPDQIAYTWWSYRTRARERNQGWRIDGFFIDANLREALQESLCLVEQDGSDHCPVLCQWQEGGSR